jgi:hypothetical protein
VGRLTIDQAGQRLGIGPAMFYKLRTEVLEAGLARLEPRPMGRPPHQPTVEDAKREELEHRVAELESELKIAEVREEIAQVMPHMANKPPGLKKTTRLPPSKRRKKRRRPGR